MSVSELVSFSAENEKYSFGRSLYRRMKIRGIYIFAEIVDVQYASLV